VTASALNSAAHETPYLDLALQQAPRLVSLIDRNPHSRTRGSFSRTHWAWKFSDFPYPRLQEGVYALSQLFAIGHPQNPLYQAPAVPQWIAWGLEYWADRQHGNGAFDEAYPNEQCLAATAFTTFYLGSVYLEWRSRLDEQLQQTLDRTFTRAGEWLCTNDETHGLLSNHLGVAVAALEIMARLCQRPDFSARAQMFRDRILTHQSSDGWMQEYDGADIGYGTHGFFYLAAYWQMTGCAATLGGLRRFAAFLRYFVHPDGTLGGEYSSRNTEFCYPAGFEILAPVCEHSAALARAMRDSLATSRACGVASMDDFNLMPMLNNLFFAARASGALSSAAGLPWQGPPFKKYFADAGLWVINSASHYAIVGLGKGGTVSLFDKAEQRMSARHAGLIARGDGHYWSSQDYVRQPAVTWSNDGEAVEVEVPWKRLGQPVFGPVKFMAFRTFSITLGAFPAVSRWLKDLLVRTLIRRKVRPAVRHRRRIALTDDGICIDDDISMPGQWSELTAYDQFTSVHMGSAMYADVRTGFSTFRASWTAAGALRLHAELTRAGQLWTCRTSMPSDRAQ
jgi:hypothetical protein